MYDADLMARKTDDHGDKVRVSASRFVTSRYANPREMVEALGCTTSGPGAPLPPTEQIIDASAAVPTDVDLFSDRSFDQAMADMGLDTLALPREASRIIQIWQPAGGGAMLHCVAILVDALEPLNREASVVVGSQVETVSRCSLTEARIDGKLFQLARMTANSTRALLIAPPGFTAPIDADSFELEFQSYNPAKPGADKAETIIGRKRIRTVPFVIEIEGF